MAVSLAGCGIVVVVVVVAVSVACATGALRCGVGFASHVDPPASQLVNFDASQASMHLSLNNVTLANGSGTATVAIKDEDSGQLIGAESFKFEVNGNVATFQNPVAVNAWMHSFSDYSGNVDIQITANGLEINRPPPGEHGSVTGTAYYAGSPYAAGSGYVSTPPGGGGGCGPGCYPGQNAVQAPTPGSS